MKRECGILSDDCAYSFMGELNARSYPTFKDNRLKKIIWIPACQPTEHDWNLMPGTQFLLLSAILTPKYGPVKAEREKPESVLMNRYAAFPSSCA